MNTEGLEALLARVREASGPSREIDEAVALALCDEHFFAQLADAPIGTGCEMYRMGLHSFSSALRVTASVDAALALVERLMGTESPSMVYSYDLNWHASAHAEMAYTATLHIAVASPPDMQKHHGQAHTQPLAILTALLTALIAGAAS